MPLTEKKWHEARIFRPMWAVLRSASSRKLRLVACASCRTIWPLIYDSRSQDAVDGAELYADGHQSRKDLGALEYSAIAAADEYYLSMHPEIRPDGHWAIYHAHRAAAAAVHLNKSWLKYAIDAVDFAQKFESAERTAIPQRVTPAELARDIFGNPFRPVTLDPRWLSSTVLDLANLIYNERQFDRMPLLADALMDAGCDNEEIIKHCQGPGPHVRGCWVVDLLLSKQ